MQFQWGLKESTEELKTEVAAIEEVLEVFKADADLVDNRAANPGGQGGGHPPPRSGLSGQVYGTVRSMEPSGLWNRRASGPLGPPGLPDRPDRARRFHRIPTHLPMNLHGI